MIYQQVDAVGLRNQEQEGADIVDKCIWQAVMLAPIKTIAKRLRRSRKEGYYSSWSRNSIREYSRRDPDELGQTFLLINVETLKHSTSGRPQRFTPEEIVQLKQEFITRNLEVSQLEFSLHKQLKYSSLNAIRFHPNL